SEVTGLVTPPGAMVEIRFSNGTPVATKNKNKKEVEPTIVAIPKIAEKQKVKSAKEVQAFVSVPTPVRQEAAVLNAFATTAQPSPQREEEGSLWPWYIGAAFLAAFALIAVRFAQAPNEKRELTPEDFEIIDDEEPY
ncbi:MAG: hypothetical protein ABL927_11865, partial [Bdellovibrionales bacterium]